MGAAVTEPLVVDSSALVALALAEPEALALRAALLASPQRAIGAFSLLETTLVLLRRKGPPGRRLVEALADRLRLDVVPLDGAQVRLARAAWERFGKGRHPAALNIGDCCSYAVARQLARPLLCKGDDFPQTDLPLVRW